MWDKLELKAVYGVGMVTTAWSVTVAAFLGCWALAIWKFGWLLGLPLGWIPAVVVAGVVGYVAGLLWPLLIVAVPALAWYFFLMDA